MSTETGTTGRDVSAEVAFLTRALKAPTRESVGQPPDRTRARVLDPRGIPDRLSASLHFVGWSTEHGRRF